MTDHQTIFALSESEGQIAAARLSILTGFHAWRRSTGLAVAPARERYAALYNNRQTALDNGVYELIPHLSASTLKGWERRFIAEGLNGLVRRYGNRKGDGIIDRDADVRAWIIGQLTTQPSLSSPILINGLCTAFPDKKLPSRRSLQRWISHWKAGQ